MEQIIEVLSGSLTEVIKIGVVILIGVAFTYINKGKELVEKTIGITEANNIRETAIEIAEVIEKRYNLGELVGNKIDEFEKMILERIPGLDKKTIDYIRDAAVIEIDKQIENNDIFKKSKKEESKEA